MGLKFYFDYKSQPCRALAIFCRMNNIIFDDEIVDFATGQTRSPEYKKINPVGKVPCMDDNGWMLTESVAIFRYLLATRDIPESWYPKDVKARARVDEFISWQHTGVRVRGAQVFITVVFEPKRKGKPLDLELLKDRVSQFEHVLDQMENYFLKDRDYVGGDHLTIADLLAICELQQPASINYDYTEGRPRLVAWEKRVKDQIQPHFDETHREIYEFGAKFKDLVDFSKL